MDQNVAEEEKKESFGDQVIAQAEKEEQPQGIRETTNAMGESYLRELNSCIKKHEHMKIKYYIMALMRKDMGIDNAVHVTFCARRTRPKPSWNCSLFEVDNPSNTVTLLWTLPHEEEARQVVKRPDLFTEKFVEDCYLHLKGRLE